MIDQKTRKSEESTQAVLYYVQHVAVLMGRQSDQVLQEQLGIGLSQYKILQTLHDNPLVQQKQIANLLGQTEASISRQVKLMLARGMVTVEVSPQNRREHRTCITPKGERLLEAGTEIVTHYHLPALGSLKPKQQAALLEFLARLHTELCVVDGLEGVVHSRQRLQI